ncbi:hypothetical protein AX16_009122 [Volvariella volvacea WC 439]|nr:hypothetical protein AX16_009122 [Volvariella volvacea WC 439]
MISNKRRKLDEGPQELYSIGDVHNSALYHVLDDVDLEIGLRSRLMETVESRITWALCLQNALNQESRDAFGSTTFRNAAVEASKEVEDPVQLLLSHEIPAPPNLALLQQRNSRPPPKPKAAPATRNPNTSFLYIRADAAPGIVPRGSEVQPPPEYYLLRCPGCNRRTFTSLQGLLNHGRISHHLEWGTHDECVRACATVDTELDISTGIEVGLGPAGLLPGLRSLFEMAVGSTQPPLPAQPLLPSPSPNTQMIDPAVKVEAEEATLEYSEMQDEGNHLTRTLGLHKDMPALAPFLGKQPVKRGIRVWDDGNDVDILGFANSSNEPGPGPAKRRWRMPFSRRNDEEYQTITLGDQRSSSPTERDQKPPQQDQATSRPHDSLTNTTASDGPASGSRFHFSVRVILADRSLWIPPEQRLKGKEHHTHKWMISVTSPSYSHNIATVLHKISAGPCSGPSGHAETVSISEPPYAVMGTTDQPFLARVELLFNGTERDKNGQTVVLEHWVDLDPLRSSNVVLGEEQVVDVELDRMTLMAEQKRENPVLTSRLLWDALRAYPLNPQSSHDKKMQGRSSGTPEVEDYEQMLKSLLPKCPMTLRDTPGGRPPREPLPYRLVSTPAYFKSLVPGRRKAIEWGRARALQELYERSIQDFPVEHRPISLTTADVYAWLSDRDHFPRPRVHSTTPAVEVKKEGTDKQSIESSRSSNSWCPICGLKFDVHPTVPLIKEEDPSDSLEDKHIIYPSFAYRLETKQIICSIVPPELQITRIPIIGLNQFSKRLVNHSLPGSHSPAKPYRASDLLVVAEPRLTLAIHNVIGRYRLPCFGSWSNLAPSTNLDMPRFVLDNNETRDSFETRLAPHALLALATASFLKVLVRGGLEIARRDRISVTGQLASNQSTTRKGTKKKDPAVSMLTPVHILRGVIERGRNRGLGVDVAVLECLARVGKTMDMNRLYNGEL